MFFIIIYAFYQHGFHFRPQINNKRKMEITKIFKACVKAAKVKSRIETNNDILPRSKKKEPSSFNSKAIDVVSFFCFFKGN